jgi:hypothetical protein
MRRRTVDLWSPAIGAAGTVVAYGHWGRPVLVFPHEMGGAEDFESWGMVDVVADLIDGGRVMLKIEFGVLDEHPDGGRLIAEPARYRRMTALTDTTGQSSLSGRVALVVDQTPDALRLRHMVKRLTKGEGESATSYSSGPPSRAGRDRQRAAPRRVARCWASRARRINSKVCAWGLAVSLRSRTSRTRSE